MVDNLFNPDIPNVPLSEGSGTRPISGPGADKSTGQLLTGIGKGLSEAGDLVKDSIKVKDFNNKKFIEGHEQIDLGMIRDEQIDKGIAQNYALRGESPTAASKAGILDYSGEDPNTSPMEGNMPPQMMSTSLNNKSSTLALAKVNQDQLDIYYNMRVNNMLKNYRNSYPEYRDYVDQVAERNGFGNSANRLLASLTKANLQLQSAVAQNSGLKEELPIWKKAVEEGYVHPNTYAAAVNGDAGAQQQIRDIAGKQFKIDGDLKRNAAVIGSGAYGEKNIAANSDLASRGLAEAYRGTVAADMANMETGHLGAILRDIQKMQGEEGGGKNTEQRLLALSQQAQAQMGRLKRTMDSYASTEIPMTMPNPNGGPPIPTGDNKSYRFFLKQEQINSHIGSSLGVAEQILTDAGAKKFDLANMGMQFTTAYNNDYLRALYFHPDVASAYATFKSTMGLPEAAREFMTNWITPDVMSKMGKEMASVATDHGAAMANGETGVKESLDKVKDAKNGQLNRTLLELAYKGPQSTVLTDEQRGNIAEAFFAENQRGLLAKMPAQQRAAFFSQITSPEQVKAMMKMGPARFNQYFDYVTNEVRDGVFAKELNDVKGIDLTSIPGLKISYHPEDKQWSVDYKGQTGVNLSPSKLKVEGGVGFEQNYITNFVSPTVNRLNGASTGLKTVLEAKYNDKTQVDAYLRRIFDGADKDQTAQGTLGGRMWNSLKTFGAKVYERGSSTDDQGKQ